MPALTPANDLVRARNVSASEVYALMGHHPYSSPTKIWDRLMSPAMDTHSQSEAMAMGVYFEKHIAKYAALKLGLKVRAASRTIEYKGYPTINLCATPDYYVLNSRMLMEVKLSSILYGWTEDDLHPHYEYQARAQMACTNRDVVIVAAMVGSTFYHVEVVRDLQKERDMLQAVDTFWNTYVLTGIRPEPETQTRLRSAKVSRS